MINIEHTDYLFVYGTLRTESDNAMARLLHSYSVKSEEAYFYGKLFNAGHFPAAKYSDNISNKVHGELIKIEEADKIITKLDQYEGYNPGNPERSLFVREKRNVFTEENNQKVNAWIYLYNKSTVNLDNISSGDYLAYLEKSS